MFSKRKSKLRPDGQVILAWPSVLTEGHASNPMSKANFCKVILAELKHMVVHVLRKLRPTKSYCRKNLVTFDTLKKMT